MVRRRRRLATALAKMRLISTPVWVAMMDLYCVMLKDKMLWPPNVMVPETTIGVFAGIGAGGLGGVGDGLG